MAISPTSSVGTLKGTLAQNLEARPNSDNDVETGRPIINIPYVSTYALGHLLDGCGFPPQAIDLRPTGQTRLYVKSAIVIGDKNPILIV